MKRKNRLRFENDRFRRSIFLLPNLFTTTNLFCGFYAIIASINGKFVPAAYAILVASVFDNLDGKVARATRTTSQFGVEYDSLADLVSFGVAPGVMIYLWMLTTLGRIGWLAAFLFVACGALRLARFNTQVDTVSSDYFIGLPIPASAGMNAATVLFCHKLDGVIQVQPYIILGMLYILSFLMVSTIKYSSFKKMILFRQMNFNMLVTAILIMIFIAAQPAIALFLIGVTYVLSGPLITWRHHRLARQQDANAEKKEDQRSNFY